jgi:pre-60S factor REI1
VDSQSEGSQVLKHVEENDSLHQIDTSSKDGKSAGINKKTAIDSLKICLFCNHELAGVKQCIEHMSLVHSFFILDLDCVINFKGLLSYMAERVHLGYLCLFCSHMFKDARRC